MKKDLNDLQFNDGEMLLLDKPFGWTSFGLVTQLKKWTKAKIGHAGTLDPLAGGLMICCTGKMTKKLGGLLGMPKEYTGIIHLGATTPTYDLESMPENPQAFQHLSTEEIDMVRQQFVGEIEQYPPVHSAVKQDGKPVYALARQGKDVQMKSRRVNIETFEITRIDLPEIHFRIACSSGTYIRSIANDFGAVLGCGAYLQKLVRTAIGPYRLEEAFTVKEMSEHFGSLMNARIITPKG